MIIILEGVSLTLKFIGNSNYETENYNSIAP